MVLSLSLRRFLATLGLMLVSLVAGAVSVAPPLGADAGAAVPPPAEDPFYVPPSPLPAGAPGAILRSRPVTVSVTPGGLVPSPVSAWQVLYLSTSALGAPTAVSGTVLVPDAPWAGGPRPL